MSIFKRHFHKDIDCFSASDENLKKIKELYDEQAEQSLKTLTTPTSSAAAPQSYSCAPIVVQKPIVVPLQHNPSFECDDCESPKDFSLIKLKAELKQEIVTEVFEEIFKQLLDVDIISQKEMKEKLNSIMKRMGYER
jgi:hypothetical protein